MTRLLREPLLHFLLIGAVLFVVYGKVAPPDRAGMSIVVSEAMVDQIAREHEARWTRKPGDQELAALVESYVRDEILYREGLTLGLDRDDALIKRRVRQKLEVMSEEQSARGAPSDAELSAYISANAGRFVVAATVSFEQVFLDSAANGAEADRAVAAARAALARGADPAKLGRATMLPLRLDDATQEIVARDFGAAFARQVETAPLGTWTGPVASSFGAHLLRVTARAPAVLPPLDKVRVVAVREWENERRAASRNDSYRKLRAQYSVVVESKKLAALATP